MKSLDSLVWGGKDTDGLFRLVRSEEADNCDLFKFLCNVSRKNVDGSWVVDESELLNKLCAIGYLLHPIKYRHDSYKAVISIGSEASGKSLLGCVLQQLMPCIHLNAAVMDNCVPIMALNRIASGTRLVIMDDVVPIFNFELLFPYITGSWPVYNGHSYEDLPVNLSPKLYITKRAEFMGRGSSFSSRQWYLHFSDYYNNQHKPSDDFGHLFVTEWDYEQWLLTYRFMNDCIRLYMDYSCIL